MNLVNIDGLIRKIQTNCSSKVFFDFEFWAETDEDTIGLVCFTQRNNPYNLFISKMTADELKTANLNLVRDRIMAQTHKKDIVFPKIIRFKEKKMTIDKGFQQFLKEYESPTPVYESIFSSDEEATVIEKLSIDEFKGLGGEIFYI